MLIEERKQRATAAKLDDRQIQRIKDFVQGSVYCFCKNCPDTWFAARDLFGGENYYWEGLPLVELYNWHYANKSDDPVSMAGKDLGWLLLDVIIEDKRTFERQDGYTSEYKWTGRENTSTSK